MKSYYVANTENHKEYFGNAPITCVDGSMIFQLAKIHKKPVEQILRHFHPATAMELNTYQSLDSFIGARDILNLWHIAKRTHIREDFVQAAARYAMWQDLPGDVIPGERLDFLRGVWESAHRGLRHMLSLISMSTEDLCETICAQPNELASWYDAPQLIPNAKLCLMLEMLYHV